MKSLLVILAGLIITWILTDVHSPSGIFNLLMPLLCIVFAIALLIWLAFALAGKRIESNKTTAAADILTEHHRRK